MKKSTIASLLAFAALAPAAAFASDGTITINGAVTAQTCTINGSGSKDFTVTLPQVSSTAFPTVGAKAGATKFTIALTNCTPAGGNARAFFEVGSNVDTTTGRLKNTGAATDVQIGLATMAGADIVIGAGSGSQNTTYVPITSGSANLDYLAQYVSTGAVGVGAVTTSVTYSIEFQ